MSPAVNAARVNITDFLPISREDMFSRDWYYYDFLLITGDAYVDHPSFGAAVIGRVLEAEGFRVAVLAQPDYKSAKDIKAMGRPRYAALITAGNLDSMVAKYTAAKKLRKDDIYSPGKKAGLRPDRACIVYSKLVREAFGDLPIILGGLEASLRRFAHYDYWDDDVKRPILFEAKADMLVFGMGESAITQAAKRLAKKELLENITNVRGTAYIADNISKCVFKNISCDSFEKVAADKKAYARSAMTQFYEHDAISGKAVTQKCGNKFLVVNPPAPVPKREELDKIYSLKYTREVHPIYEKYGGVAAIEEVRFSVIHNRGCFGACNFCALAFHQGRIVSSRSHESVIKEIESFVGHPLFKGYVHDIGGPTANFRKPSCKKQLKAGMCKRSCLAPEPCRNVDVSHKDYLSLLRKAAGIKGVKKVFVRSGIRFDYLMLDKDGEFFGELIKNHISGQLKVAPEHNSEGVLNYMGKPPIEVFESFCQKYEKINKRLGKKQFLVPYLISSHPGSSIDDAIFLAEYLNKTGRLPEQVQDFYPTPGTLSTCMYHTGLDPRTLTPMHIPKTPKEKAAQRTLLQWNKPANRAAVREILKKAGRHDLIGFGKGCLVRPK